MFTSVQKHFGENFPEKKLFAIEFKRGSVISLYLAGKPQVAIVRTLQYLNVNKSSVYRIISRYGDIGSVARRQESERKKTTKSAEMD